MMPGICVGGCIVDGPGDDGVIMIPGMVCCACAAQTVARSTAPARKLDAGSPTRRVVPVSRSRPCRRRLMFTCIVSCPSLDLRTQVAVSDRRSRPSDLELRGPTLCSDAILPTPRLDHVPRLRDDFKRSGDSQAPSIAGNPCAPALLCTFHNGRGKANARPVHAGRCVRVAGWCEASVNQRRCLDRGRPKRQLASLMVTRRRISAARSDCPI